jgi:hypothetical protein
LNVFQKSLLISAINYDVKDKTGMIEAVLDRLTFFINPEIFHKEAEFRKTGKVPGVNENVDFSRQSASGRLTGRPELSPILRNALEDARKKDPRRPRIIISGPLDKPVVVSQGHVRNDPGELG